MRKFAFANRVVDLWNDLPSTVVAAETVESFKAWFDEAWKIQPVKYNPNEPITTKGTGGAT